jgi:hypothetical protein
LPISSRSRASVTNIELGRQSVLVDQLCRFAAALGVKPVDLLQCAAPSREERQTEDLTPDAAAWIDRARRKVAQSSMPKPLRVRYSRIQSEVDSLLSKYNVVRPPIDISAIAEGEGTEISYELLENDLCGFLSAEGQNSLSE